MPAEAKKRIFASMRDLWAGMPQAGDSGKIIEADRNR
jgi:hypothetical protein